MAKTFARAKALWILFFAFAIAASAQQSGNPAANSAPSLKIGSGDLIEVTMFDNQDLSGRFRVDENGDIVVPLIGRVHVEGLTADDAARLIEQRYVEAQILPPGHAHATIFISEFTTQRITVGGEVKSPGVYPALGIRKLNDVITAAGGVTITAASKVVITHRDDPGNPITVVYNPEALSPVIPDVQIFPGDTLTIPRAGIVYVVGAVARAGGYVLDGRNTLTVEEVMALAGGGAHAAALKRVQLVRALPDGSKEAVTIPVNLIYKGRAPDVALKDGDILYVPISTAKLVSEQAITTALGIGTSLVFYRATNGNN